MRLVAEHWGEISAIATALVQRKRIDAVEAGLIIRIATGDGDAQVELDAYRAAVADGRPTGRTP